MSENLAPHPQRRPPAFLRLFNRLPPIIQKSIDLSRLLLKPIITIIALYAALFLLHVVAFIPDMLPEAESRAASSFFSIRTDAYSINLTDRTYGVHIGGQTTPRATVVFGVHERQLGEARADSNGNFWSMLYLPIASRNRVWVRAFLEDQLEEEDTLTVLLPAELNTPPSLEMATYIPELNRLWISGFGTPHQAIHLSTGDDNLEENIRVDLHGVFDALIEWQGTIPDVVIVKQESLDETLLADFLSPSITDLADLPLARQIKLALADDPNTIDIRVSLPIEHPYFHLMAQGFIDAESFLLQTTGGFPRAQGYEHDLRINNGIGEVIVRGVYSSPIPGFYLYQFNENNIRSQILLTEYDSVLIDYGSYPVSWINPPVPQSEVGDGIAIWTGPLAKTDNRYLIDVGFINPEAQPYLPSSEPFLESEVKVETGDRFARQTEYYYFEEFPRRTWRAILYLIPYLGVYWIATRYRFSGKRQVWLGVIALTLLLALWKNWSYFLYLFEKGPEIWIARPLEKAFNFFKLSPPAGTLRTLYFYSDDHAFWLMLLFLLAITPIAYPFLRRKLRRKRIQALWPPTSGRKRLAFALRLTLFIIATSILVFSFTFYTDLVNDLHFYENIIEMLDETITFSDSEEELQQLLTALLQPTRLKEIASILTKTNPIQSLVDYANWVPVFYVFLPLIQAILLILIFLSIDFSLAIFGCGLALILARLLLAQPTAIRLLDKFITDNFYYHHLNLMEIENYIPWSAVIVILGLLSYPLIAKLIKTLLPKSATWRFLTFMIAAAFITFSLGADLIPQFYPLLAASLLVLVVLIWLIIVSLRRFSPFDNTYRQLRQAPLRFYGILILLGWIVVRPIENNQALYLNNIRDLINQIDNLFFYVLVLAMALMLRQFAQKRVQANADKIAIEDPFMLITGMIFFSIFVINSTTSLFLIPIPFLVALLVVRVWLFIPPEHAVQLNAGLKETSGKRQAFIQDILIADRVANQLDRLNKAFSKTPTDINVEETYDRLKIKLDERKEKIILKTDGLTARDTVFVYGEKNLWENALTMVYSGLVLALVPFSFFLYDFLPKTEIRYPYPFTNILITMFQALASWLIYAFFFGYFYPNIRGRTGLAKGMAMFVAVVVPFALYRVLSTQSLEEMASFFLWALQIFLFFTLLGLITDLRILQKTRHKTRDILVIHNWPAISAYISTIIAAVPAIATLFNLDIYTILDLLAEFFTKIILGAG
jgi:hypothetical protein